MINAISSETGSEKLNDFAKLAGMSADKFAKAFEEDASGALMSFIDGLSKSGEKMKVLLKYLMIWGLLKQD